MKSNFLRFFAALSSIGAGLIAVSLVQTVWTSVYGLPVRAEPTTLSLGRVATGGTGNAVVYLKNTSGRILHLEKPITGCGCTKIKAPTILLPNESAPVSVTFEAAAAPGQVYKSVSLTVSEYSNRSFTIPITGTVYEAFRLEPKQISLGTVEAGTKRGLTFQIHRPDGKPMVLRPEDSSNAMHVSVVTALNGTAQIQGDFTAPLVPGYHTEFLRVATGDRDLPNIIAKVDYTVRPHFTADPPQANFGIVTNTAKALTVSISGPARQILLKTVPAGVAGDLYEKDTNHRTLTVQLKAQGRGTILDERLVLATDDPKQPQIIIPVYAAFQR